MRKRSALQTLLTWLRSDAIEPILTSVPLGQDPDGAEPEVYGEGPRVYVSIRAPTGEHGKMEQTSRWEIPTPVGSVEELARKLAEEVQAQADGCERARVHLYVESEHVSSRMVRLESGSASGEELSNSSVLNRALLMMERTHDSTLTALDSANRQLVALSESQGSLLANVRDAIVGQAEAERDLILTDTGATWQERVFEMVQVTAERMLTGPGGTPDQTATARPRSTSASDDELNTERKAVVCFLQRFEPVELLPALRADPDIGPLIMRAFLAAKQAGKV